MEEYIRARLKSAWAAFRRAQSLAACALLYYLALTPYAVLARLFGVRFLEAGPDARESFWTERKPGDPAETARRLY